MNHSEEKMALLLVGGFVLATGGSGLTNGRELGEWMIALGGIAMGWVGPLYLQHIGYYDE